jgi:hypothetical protein
MSRYEARVHNRYLKALKHFQSLSAAGDGPNPPPGPQPVPIRVDPGSSAANQSAPSPTTSIRALHPQPPQVPICVPPRSSAADPLLQNEPNFDATPAESVPGDTDELQTL